MKLYCLPGACSLTVRIALEWIGQPYEAQNVPRDQLRSETFLAINPSGCVPALVEDDGWVLVENVAIHNYLIDRFPEAGLGGDGSPRARAAVNRWLGYLNSDVHPAFRPMFGAGRFHPDAAQHPALADAAAARVRELLGPIEDRLGAAEWLAGFRSPADAYLFVVLRWAAFKKIDTSGLPHLQAFFERMSADPAVQRALAADAAK